MAMGKFEDNGNMVSQKNTCARNLVLYLHDLVHMLAVTLLVFLIFFRVAIVSGPSMYSTLTNGDYLLLTSNLFYHNPKQGDVVVVTKESFDNGTPIVKRVIATEGQIVDIDFELGIVYVDGIPLNEDYVNTPTNVEEGMIFPLLVKEGCVFVMGDNRNSSKDSRSPEIGLVDNREVLGKALLLFLPGRDIATNEKDFSRIGVIR